jgi:hypothetical protein
MDMWSFHQIDRTVEFWRGAGRLVWFEQTRRSDGGGDVGRAGVETMCAGWRLVFEGGMRRQRLVPAQDTSLPRHCDYWPAAVVRVHGYKWLVDRSTSRMLLLCFQRWSAPAFPRQRPAPFYFNTLPQG